MGQIAEVVNLVTGIVTTILIPLLGVFMFYDSKKRKEAASAEKAETENNRQYVAEWRELYEKKEAKVHELDAKIDQLYIEKNDDRMRMREQLDEISRLKLQNQALEFIKCHKALKCSDREPPNEFIKKTINIKEDDDNK